MLSRGRRRSDGFTLIELIVTVAIVGVIAAALAGVVIQYLRVTVSARTRMNESPDEQFVAAYFQQDFSSVGVHATDTPTNYFNSSQSVWTGAAPAGVPAACSGLTGTVIGFTWNDYSTATTDQTTGQWSGVTSNAAVYTATASGSQYILRRVRCVGSTATTIVLASHLSQAPSQPVCSGGGAAGCNDATGAIPRLISLTITVADKTGGGSVSGSTGYTSTITAERRQS